MGTTNMTLINKLQKLQNFAAKTAMRGAKRFDHVTPILKEQKWISKR